MTAQRQGLKGRAGEAATPQPKASGWHPTEWGCEYLGTAFQLALGFSVVALLESDRSALRHHIPWGGVRLLAIKLLS